MTDPTPQQPTEEEIRAYLTQIREADPAAIIVQAYRLLGEGAELKLGRSDARVLIDAMAAVVESTSGRLDGQLTQQMREGVAQLQMAQVQAEAQQGSGSEEQGAEGAAGAGTQPAGAEAAGSQGPAGPQQAGGQQSGSGPSVTDRLWIPGRDPRA